MNLPFQRLLCAPRRRRGRRRRGRARRRRRAPREGRAHHDHADGRRTAVRQHSGLARGLAHERRRHLREGHRQRGLRLGPRRRRRASVRRQGGGKAASGSGFVIDTEGHIVTNDHVVEGASTFTVRFGENGDPIQAKLLGKDPSTDLAVLSVDPKVAGGLKPLELASSK